MSLHLTHSTPPVFGNGQQRAASASFIPSPPLSGWNVPEKPMGDLNVSHMCSQVPHFTGLEAECVFAHAVIAELVRLSG